MLLETHSNHPPWDDYTGFLNIGKLQFFHASTVQKLLGQSLTKKEKGVGKRTERVEP